MSPLDGRIGIRMVNSGNYVQTSDSTGLVMVTQLQLISVLFTLAEDEIAPVRRAMKAGTVAVEAFDRPNTRWVATGALASMDTQVDNTTGTVKLRATFPNDDEALFRASS